jgi:hypothetical protein
MKNRIIVDTVKKRNVRRKIWRTGIRVSRALPTIGEKTKPRGKAAQVDPKFVALLARSDAPAMYA